MDSEKYNRSVSMLCPTCGCSQFSSLEGNVEDAALVKCASCGLEITKEDLLEANGENIEVNLDEMKEQVTKDLGKDLKKMLEDTFKGNKYIKVT